MAQIKKRVALTAIRTDRVDHELIALLQEDGRMPLTELAKKLGVSHGTVRNRLQRLTSGEVLRMAAIVDPAKVGFPTHVYIGMGVELDRVIEVERHCLRFEEVFFVVTVTGRYDIILGAAFPSDAGLRDFLTKKLSGLRGIRLTETLHVLNTGRRLWQWRIPPVAARGRRLRLKGT
jgi:Lrp/AsnC family transcriptional regulator for asnA, asnC and gidA